MGATLCAQYGLSKGKSLVIYINEASGIDAQKLLFDLLVHMRTENPTDEIGESKDLIESCCKTVFGP